MTTPLHAAPGPSPAPGAAGRRSGGDGRLAICLPTYNRSALLAESLAALIAAVRPHRIPIHVSDNHSDDDTGAVVRALQTGYDLLHYSRCDAVLPVDDHFKRVLALPDTDYRWLFGDHYRIVGDDGLRQVLAALDDGPDVVVVNAESRVQGVPTQTFTRQDDVLAQIGWHMTMMTSLIYGAAALAAMDFDRFRRTQLIQTLSILEYLDRREFRLRWIGDAVVGSLPALPANHWHARALEIFVRNWFVGILSLPPGYAYEAKLQALRSHAANVPLFSWRGMLYLRSLGAIDRRRLAQHARELPYVFDAGQRLGLRLALLLPVGLVRSLKRLAARLRTRRTADA